MLTFHLKLKGDSLSLTRVMELEQYKEEMPPARQMMVYKHLIQPFLSRNSSAG